MALAGSPFLVLSITLPKRHNKMDYSALASSYLGGGAGGAVGGGGNSSSLTASQDSTFGFNNNADFTVGAKQNNVPMYVFGGVAALALIVLFLKK